MAREREIKIRLKGVAVDELIQRIQKLGFVLERAIKQTDIYFDTEDWFLYDQLAALRLRKVNGQDSSFSFKKLFYLPKKTDKHYIEEIETKFPPDRKTIGEILAKLGMNDDLVANSGEELTKFFVSNGYLDSQKMQKTRKVFSYHDSELVIDDVDQVGLIIELECQSGEPMELVRSFLTNDEWERDLEGTSYIWLRKVKGLNRHLNHLKRFETDPEWNVLVQEREYYLGISQ